MYNFDTIRLLFHVKMTKLVKDLTQLNFALAQRVSERQKGAGSEGVKGARLSQSLKTIGEPLHACQSSCVKRHNRILEGFYVLILEYFISALVQDK